ncbi:MAG: hypothetical protein QOG62_2797 [Thermoleophilaceae bacterium]|jgi:hypothetical protein|nr:hypothetical protein [Thermoleophilaceae bacterium]
MDAEARFAEIQAAYADDPRVTFGTGFGPSAGMRVDGQIFAMLVHPGIAVKLPRDRVLTLIEAGEATPFGMGRKRPMKEWAAIPIDSDRAEDIVAEAYAFVGGTALGA